MQRFVLGAGAIALRYRGKVKNLGKPEYDLVNHSRDGATKTIVDEIVQELFLAEVYKNFPQVNINVEEDTTLLKLFKTPASRQKKKKAETPNHTLHLDPVDGTRSYLEEKKEFAIGLAISDQQNNFTHTVIYAPVIDRLFVASPKRAFISDKYGRKYRAPREKNGVVLYEKRILSARGRALLRKMGFERKDPPSAHLAILETALGKSAAFLYGGSNPHDSLIPYAFAKFYGIEPVNIHGSKINGENLKWRQEGRVIRFQRIPSICYFSRQKEVTKRILSLLSQRDNLHPLYLKEFAHLEP